MDLRQQSLKTVFISYLISVTISILVVLGLMSIGMNILIKSGMIIPANADEKIAYTLKSQLEGKTVLVPEDFKSQCHYALFDKKGQLTKTNIEDLTSLKAYIIGNKPEKTYYVMISGKENDAVIEYQLAARYTMEFLQNYLPNVEVMYLVSLIGAMLLAVLLVSNSYGRKLKKALLPLEKAVEAIEMQDLDFEVAKSSIKEFDAIGKSIDSMKEALKESLVGSWLLEKKKREQMAALAHDIKTPLTIIKGSAELLEEDGKLEQDQYMLSTSIRRNADKIQEYIQLLMSISNEGGKERVNKVPISLKVFLNKIVEQAEPLGKLRNISIDLEIVQEEIVMDIDCVLMSRALINIISNGIEYTPVGKQISIKGEQVGNKVVICISDEGVGFTKEDMEKVCEPFFMGDESRHHKGHYGMGLYIAKQIITKHNGDLTIQNHIDKKGGQVMIRLPVGEKGQYV